MSEQTGNQSLGRGYLFAFAAVILWSGNFIVARALNKSISPISLAFFRWLLATVFLLPFALSKLKAEWRTLLPHTKYLAITAFTGVTIFNTFIYVAGRFTTATNMALIGTTAAPVFVFLISALFLKQKPSRFQYAGILLCITGILLLLSKGDLRQLSQFRFTTGDLWILAAALSFALYTLLVRKKPQQLSATTFLFALFFLGTLFLLPAFVIDSFYSEGFEWSHTLVGTLLYISIGASVAAFLAWNASIRLIGPAKTALFGNLIPVFSTMEAAWLLGESLAWVTLVSFAVILSGIIVANFPLLRAVFKQPLKA